MVTWMENNLYFKILDKNLHSGGIAGSKCLEYKLNEWVENPGLITNEPLRGGLFVLNDLKDINRIIKKRPNARIFICEIGDILRETRYLTKTNRIKLLKELKI